MKKINGLLLSLTVASLLGCGGGGGSSSGSSATTSGSAVTNGSTTDTSNSTNTGTSTTTSATTPLSYLNSLRNKAGMISFNDNSLLNQTASNHAKYEAFNDLYGHYESSSYSYFTGVKPSDRALYVGFQGGAGENLTAGDNTYNESIDVLFTAIYHRLNFLDFSFNEVGMARDKNSADSYYYVYNMGNGLINDLCSGSSYSGYGSYYQDICKDSSFRIEASKYDLAESSVKNLNPDVVIWPYENQQDFNPAFFEESPDPLPSCGVTGDPISVKFNDAKFNTITMSSFKLYDENNNEITNTTILNKSSDLNKMLSAYEFVLFPMERLSWDTKYNVVFTYNADGIDKEKKWSFKTKPTGYTTYKVTSSEETFNVVSNQTYAIYVPPVDCNDDRYNYNYYTGYSITLNLNDSLDANTLLFNISGNVGDVFDIVMANGKKIHLKLVEK